MKRNGFKMAVLFLAALMLLSMAACSGIVASLKVFAESEEMQSQRKVLQDQVDGLVEIDITGEDNRLIYTFTFLQNLGNTSGMSDAFKEMAKELELQKEEIFASLKSAVEVDDPVIVMKFIDVNGKEVFFQEFDSQN